MFARNGEGGQELGSSDVGFAMAVWKISLAL